MRNTAVIAPSFVSLTRLPSGKSSSVPNQGALFQRWPCSFHHSPEPLHCNSGQTALGCLTLACSSSLASRTSCCWRNCQCSRFKQMGIRQSGNDEADEQDNSRSQKPAEGPLILDDMII